MQVYGYLLDWEKALQLKAEGKLRKAPIEECGEGFKHYVEGGWMSDSAFQYQLVGEAYARLRKELSDPTRSSADAVMDLFAWDGEASCHRLRDLGEGACPYLQFLSLSPESVRRILREAEKMDFVEFKVAYEKQVSVEDQEELAPYALNVEEYIRGQWLGSLRKADKRGMGFGVYAG
jgi:hypothetical protein